MKSFACGPPVRLHWKLTSLRCKGPRRPLEIDAMSEAAATRASHILTLEEIADLAKESGKPAETLMNLAALIAQRFHVDVCSAYLLEPDRANLVLAATLGLRPQCVGTLRMSLHEGL